VDDTVVGELRAALRQALGAAQADGVFPEIRMALLISELGREMAEAAGEDHLGKLVANVQVAIERAARSARDDRNYQDAVERSIDQWPH